MENVSINCDIFNISLAMSDALVLCQVTVYANEVVICYTINALHLKEFSNDLPTLKVATVHGFSSVYTS